MIAPTLDHALPDAIRHYLSRAEALLSKIEGHPDPETLLTRRMASDMADTGFHLAVAIGFAARALCPFAGSTAPDIPEDRTVASIRAFHDTVASLVAPAAFDPSRPAIGHRAGLADLEQAPADYLARFAFPNMLFHLTLVYAALRSAGFSLGKADFDGLHSYEPVEAPR